MPFGTFSIGDKPSLLVEDFLYLWSDYIDSCVDSFNPKAEEDQIETTSIEPFL
mgnify:CR=1 FL=1